MIRTAVIYGDGAYRLNVMRSGALEVICGCMFSGKSEELIRRMTRAAIARQNVLAVKPRIDDRYSAAAVVSHAGREFPCVTVADAVELLDVVGERVQLVGVEEAQFLGSDLPAVCEMLCARGVRVLVAGLDLDAFGRPFGCMPQLLACAEQVTKLSAVCVRCGEDATRSQLLIDGQPAPYKHGELVLVGAVERYEARCRSCHEVPGRP